VSRFDKIADDALAEARNVRCSLDRYRDGLATIRERIDEAINAADDDLKRAEKEPA
jgi:hypothetical protein